MLFAVQQSKNNTWSVVPTSGKFEGIAVAEVDGINLKDVTIEGKTLIGMVKALWGAVVLVEDVYSDHETLRALALGKSFDMSPAQAVWLDFDGVHDTVEHVVRGARAIVAMGDQLYAKGIK